MPAFRQPALHGKNYRSWHIFDVNCLVIAPAHPVDRAKQNVPSFVYQFR